MPKTIFIVAGFKHAASEQQYKWMREFFAEQGFVVKVPQIDWKNRVMSDYVQQFSDYYAKHKSNTNYVLGFSFGAMVALISASSLKPDKLFLCSLSPYFSEDARSFKPSWKKILGHRRLADFQKYSAKELASGVTAPTVVFYGGHEASTYPQLKKRCEEATATIKHSRLVVADNAPHKIDFPSYVEVIKAEF